MSGNDQRANLLGESDEELGKNSEENQQSRACDEAQRPQENRLTRWYNKFSGFARSKSKNGIKPICVFAMLNTIYNTWKYAAEQQACAPILAPGLWSLALLPKVASLYQHNQNISPEIEKVTTMSATFAVAAMFFYGKNPDRIAAGLFLPHVITPEHIHSIIKKSIPLKPIQLFEEHTDWSWKINDVWGSACFSVTCP